MPFTWCFVGAACGNRTHDLRITRANHTTYYPRYLRLRFCSARSMTRQLPGWTPVRVTTRVTSACPARTLSVIILSRRRHHHSSRLSCSEVAKALLELSAPFGPASGSGSAKDKGEMRAREDGMTV